MSELFSKNKKSPQRPPQLLTLVDYDHPLLRLPCETVCFPLSEEDRFIIRNMKYSIQKAQLKKVRAPWDSAAGMAANQWGIHKRIFLFCPEADTVHGLEVIINPSYEPLKDPNTEGSCALMKQEALPQGKSWEACFSVPLATGCVQRYTHIRATYQNEAGETIRRVLSDWPARVFQHEADHLDGFLYDDPRTGRCVEKKCFASRKEADAFKQDA
jgi:peptide deformylase